MIKITAFDQNGNVMIEIIRDVYLSPNLLYEYVQQALFHAGKGGKIEIINMD